MRAWQDYFCFSLRIKLHHVHAKELSLIIVRTYINLLLVKVKSQTENK
jgi:hypothetical protein